MKTLRLLLFIVLISVSANAQLNCSGGCGATVVVGTTTNDSAAAGNVGELISSVLGTGASVTLGTGSASSITSINLTPGDWDVSGIVDYTANVATSVTLLTQGIQSLSGCATGPVLGAQDTFTQWETAANIIGTSDPAWNVPVQRLSLAATTTVCLISKPAFTVNSLKAYGTIRARRMR